MKKGKYTPRQGSMMNHEALEKAATRLGYEEGDMADARIEKLLYRIIRGRMSYKTSDGLFLYIYEHIIFERSLSMNPFGFLLVNQCRIGR